MEDAVAGVVAARQGGFVLAVGVDRNGTRTRLDGLGADIVVADLASLDLERMSALALEPAQNERSTASRGAPESIQVRRWLW